MKMKLLILGLFFMTITGLAAKAQHVKVRISFPIGISIGAPGRAPFTGAIWIGPEWAWHGGRYVAVPGYWAKPGRFGAAWIPGHWKYSRRGYRWVPGHWR